MKWRLEWRPKEEMEIEIWELEGDTIEDVILDAAVRWSAHPQFTPISAARFATMHYENERDYSWPEYSLRSAELVSRIQALPWWKEPEKAE